MTNYFKIRYLPTEILTIKSGPHRKPKYIFYSVIAFLLSSLYILVVLNFDFVIKKKYVDNADLNNILIINIYLSVIGYTISLFPLTFMMLKVNLYKNLFLTEVLKISTEKIIFKKNNKFVINANINDLNFIEIDFNKESEHKTVEPSLIMHYKPVIHIYLKKQKKIGIFQSVEKNEVFNIYENLTKKFLQEQILFSERQTNFYTLSMDILTAKEFYMENKYYFRNLDIEVQDELIENIDFDLKKYIIKNFKLITEHKRSLHNNKINKLINQ